MNFVGSGKDTYICVKYLYGKAKNMQRKVKMGVKGKTHARLG